MENKVSVSILGADFKNLVKLSSDLRESGADMIHCDVMDGVFVPNISFGMPVIKSLDESSDMFLDVHLMIEDPYKYIDKFADAGADLITFHYESKSDPFKTIEKIKSHGIKAGISLKPGTPPDKIFGLCSMADLVLVMTVEPGFGGQPFMNDMILKIKALDSYRRSNNLDFKIQVDGGINDKTGAASSAVGADILVAGSYVLKSENMKEAVEKLQKI